MYCCGQRYLSIPSWPVVRRGFGLFTRGLRQLPRLRCSLVFRKGLAVGQREHVHVMYFDRLWWRCQTGCATGHDRSIRLWSLAHRCGACRASLRVRRALVFTQALSRTPPPLQYIHACMHTWDSCERMVRLPSSDRLCMEAFRATTGYEEQA